MIARVPASSANLGPGFDALGMALTLYAELGIIDASTAVDGDDGDPDAPGGLPVGAQPADDHHLASVAFARVGGEGRLWVRSPIPMGRGLGYSAAVRVGGLLLGLAEQAGSRGEHGDLADELADEVLEHATALEGHADNAAAAVLGGVVATTGERAIRVPLQFDPAVVVWVPPSSTRTDQSRTRMSTTVPLADAVFNIGRVAFLVAALASGDVDALAHGASDRMHQPGRFEDAPASWAAYEAALDHGAWSVWLSGSGPTVAALCAAENAVELATVLAASADGVGHTKVLRIDHGGASIET